MKGKRRPSGSSDSFSSQTLSPLFSREVRHLASEALSTDEERAKIIVAECRKGDVRNFDFLLYFYSNSKETKRYFRISDMEWDEWKKAYSKLKNKQK